MSKAKAILIALLALYPIPHWRIGLFAEWAVVILYGDA